MRIAIVGPCAAGKTTLAQKLCSLGYDAHDIAQEHSLVPTMWREIAQPGVVIYLDASLATIRRRLHVDWEQEYLDTLIARLEDAREHAHFTLNTDNLDIGQVCDRAVAFVRAASQIENQKS